MKLIAFIFLIIVSPSLALKDRPIFFFHGMMADCSQVAGITDNNPNMHCIETGGGVLSLLNLREQVREGCLLIFNILKGYLKNDPSLASNGIYFVGISQGGIIARGIFHFCQGMSDYVKGIVTIGSPNMGITQLPPTMVELQQNDTVFDQAIKSAVGSFGGFMQDGGAKDYGFGPTEYLKTSINEVEIKGTFIKNMEDDPAGETKFSNLDFMINFVFLGDTVITPPSSSVFGATYNASTNSLDDFTNTDYYIDNQFNFVDLFDEGKLINCALDGDHLAFPHSLFSDLLYMLSLSGCDKLRSESDEFDESNAYSYCFGQKIMKKNFDQVYRCQRETSYKIRDAEITESYESITEIRENDKFIEYEFIVSE